MNEPMITGRQPDSGKPTVRDERGACGNVGYGRGYTGTYSGNAETAKPHPKVARAPFLPDSPSAVVFNAGQIDGLLPLQIKTPDWDHHDRADRAF